MKRRLLVGLTFLASSLPAQAQGTLYPGAPNRASAPGGCNSTTFVRGDGTCTSPIPTGAVILVASGACPSGFSEVAALSGKFLLGTVAANGDVGGTGGADNITPAGTNANESAHTHGGSTVSWPAGVPTAANESAHTHAAGAISWPAGVPTNGAIGIGTFVNSANATSGNCAATNIAAGTGSTTACKATAPNLTVPAQGHSGTLTSPTIAWPAGVPTGATSGAGSAHTHTLSWPAGVPTNGNTGAGSAHTHTFSGTQFDNRPAYLKVIFCSAN